LAIPQKWLKFKYMRFVEIINKKKFVLISIFLFMYVLLNLLDGERGLISYLAKQEQKDQLVAEKKLLITKLNSIEIKNDLLTKDIDLDYLEILFREKFMVGKSNEKIYKNE